MVRRILRRLLHGFMDSMSAFYKQATKGRDARIVLARRMLYRPPLEKRN
ncbi:hypothetical protein MPQ_0433 [Methylovorus sp. MP688]|nr:hypothetical protein MPQ_0433 [Methylovorus sp. MP688]